MDIRGATEADIGPLDALFGASYPVLLAPGYDAALLARALPIIARAQPALVTCGSYFVAEAAGGLLGGAGWTRERPGRGDIVEGQGHVRHVVVDPACARRGVGRALMQRVIGDARAAGVRRLNCTATRTAVPFYRALGFAVLRVVDIPLGDEISFPAVEMLQDL